jgi:hypothetical protein
VPRYGCDESLRAHVLAIAGVAERVGDRLYADAAPQKPTLPYGVLSLIGDATRSARLNGDPLKTVTARYQFDWYAADKATARALAAAVSARSSDGGLDGLRRTIGAPGTATFVQSGRVENRRDDHWDPEGGGERRTYVCSFDLIVVFNE